MKATLLLSVLLCFLVATGLHAEAPELKPFKEGVKETFSTAGNPKASKVDLTISYPKGWTPADGKHPNIVKQFKNATGDAVALTIIPMGIKGTEKDRQMVGDKEFLQALMPKGAKAISQSTTQINGKLAGFIHYTQEHANKATTESVTYALLIGKNLVTINCVVAAAKDTKPTATEKMVDYKELFQLIAESVKPVEAKVP